MRPRCLTFVFLFTVCATLGSVVVGLAQTEYLVHVDVRSGEIERIANIPRVRYVQLESSSFDQGRGHFYLVAADSVNNRFVCSLDASTGNLLAQTPLPDRIHQWDNWVGMTYSSKANTMVGLHWDATTETEYFIHFDGIDGSWEEVAVIPDVRWVQTSITVDDVNGRCFLLLLDSLRNHTIRTADVNTGEILASVPFPYVEGNLLGLRYSEQLETLVGIHWDSIAKTEYLVHVDPQNGQMSIVNSIPDVMWVMPSNITFDQVRNHYIMTGADEDFNGWFLTLDAATGELIHRSDFPVFENEYDNLFMLEHDRVSDSIYAVNWEMVTPFNRIQDPIELLYPNPTLGNASLVLNANYEEVILYMHSTSGQLIWKDRFSYQKHLSLPVQDLPAGVYYVSTICDRIYNGTTKVVVQ